MVQSMPFGTGDDGARVRPENSVVLVAHRHEKAVSISHASEENMSERPDCCSVQAAPSGLVNTDPAFPVITNVPLSRTTSNNCLGYSKGSLVHCKPSGLVAISPYPTAMNSLSP